MGIKTAIEYCDSTCNPVMGCDGCELYHRSWPKEEQHCYAADLIGRYAGRKGWPKSFDQPEFFPGRIEKAIGWSDLTGKDRPKKPWLNGLPRIIFLNDLSDTFISLPSPYLWFTPLVPKMAKSPHIWLLLTKRPERMHHFFSQLGYIPENFWLGTTVTSPDSAWRLKELVKLGRIDSAVTLWLSAEPLLGDIVPFIDERDMACLDLIATGGESGKNARPMYPNWVGLLRDRCKDFYTSFFFKQWGEWLPSWQTSPTLGDVTDTKTIPMEDPMFPTGKFWKVGKKQANRLLDGKEWNEMPKVAQKQGELINAQNA